MEILNDENKSNTQNEMFENWEKEHKRGRIFGGFLFVIIGSLFLMREFGFAIPHWLLTWKMLLIVIGVYTGVKHRFRGFGWLVPILIGTVFLMQEFYTGISFAKFLWPALIILLGIKLIFKPHHRHKHTCRNRRKYNRHHWQAEYTNWQEKKRDGDFLELNAVLASVNKSVITKNFNGGDVNCVLGGCEIDFTNADLTSNATLEVNVVMGGVRLVVPPHWVIKAEVDAVMGGVEDKREKQTEHIIGESKVLTIKGSAVMGGLEIRNY
jgi:predicted membrane protein